MKRTIAITGSGGFVGTELTEMIRSFGCEVIEVHRNELYDVSKLIEIFEESDVVINLAGANIINRWTDKYKETLYNSRISTTNNIIQALKNTTNKPETFISTSAIGIYDTEGTYTEENVNYSNDFLSNLCQHWEDKALEAEKLGIRTCIFRFGIVLGKSGGALKKMLLPFKLGLGGTIGNGEQAMSFIHIEDLKNAYIYVIDNSNLKGIFNLVAPYHTTNKEMTTSLGIHLKRPTIFPVPEFVLTTLLGEGAKVLTEGQKVLPQKLLESGFEFKYSNIDKTIENLVKP